MNLVYVYTRTHNYTYCYRIIIQITVNLQKAKQTRSTSPVCLHSSRNLLSRAGGVSRQRISPSLSLSVASGKVPIFVINLDAVTDSKLGVGFEEWGEKEGREARRPLPSLLPSLRLSPLNACYQNIQFRALRSAGGRLRDIQDPTAMPKQDLFYNKGPCTYNVCKIF